MTCPQPAIISDGAQDTLNRFLGDYASQGFSIEKDDFGWMLCHEGKLIKRFSLFDGAGVIQGTCCQHLNECHNEGIGYERD